MWKSQLAVHDTKTSVFMTNNMPSGVKKLEKVLNQKISKQPKCSLSLF